MKGSLQNEVTFRTMNTERDPVKSQVLAFDETRSVTLFRSLHKVDSVVAVNRDWVVLGTLQRNTGFIFELFQDTGVVL